jgi:capsule polysaccharide export protein KpsE/RkpR
MSRCTQIADFELEDLFTAVKWRTKKVSVHLNRIFAYSAQLLLAMAAKNTKSIQDSIIKSNGFMINSHGQNAESSAASSLLIASDGLFVPERRPQHSAKALSRYREQGGNANVRVDWMGSRDVMPGGNSNRRCGACSNGAVEAGQRGTYFQRRWGTAF